MTIKIEDLEDKDLSYRLSEIKTFTKTKEMLSLIEFDPRNELLLQARSLEYRLKQEATLREVEPMTKEFDEKFKDLEYVELTPDELQVAIPELPADPETGEVDFYGKDDGERPEEAEPEGDEAPSDKELNKEPSE